MLSALRRKTSQLVHDPVLRRWLLGATVGRYRRPAGFTAGRPPYLDSVGLVDAPPAAPKPALQALDARRTGEPITLLLPGAAVMLQPCGADELFSRRFDDTETLLAVHRFAWLPLLGASADPAWVYALWRAWSARYGAVDESWAWHPYTAAERAINILAFAQHAGLPGDRDETLALLARHGTAILERLEYFGDHNTGNHLSNNGRGLFMLGLALGIDAFADTGGRILLAEAERIFTPAGVLREGSTHYHLLLTRNYAAAWLAARAHDRPETARLEAIARRALAVIPHLTLPGGMPLIGDISPDCPPGFLSCLAPGGAMATGWGVLLSTDDRDALKALKDDCGPPPATDLAGDGWVRFGAGPWTALCHVPPDGWPPMPGHGHQDIGGFELHFEDMPLFIDTGRGAYGDRGEAARYVAARAHNGVTVDGNDPYPANKPYYDEIFRRAVDGAAPRVSQATDRLEIAHGGFSRLGGVGVAVRSFAFDCGGMHVTDLIEGASRRRINRRLHTTLATRQDGNTAIIEAHGRRFRVKGDGVMSLTPGNRWTAYGVAEPATVIDIEHTGMLPVELRLSVEAL